MADEEDKKKKSYYTVGAVDKMCDLIEALSERDAWDLAELVKRMQMPKTSVHRFLLTLADRGYVVQEKRRGRYSLSFKLFSIASRVVEQTSLLKTSRPFAEKLRDTLGETVNVTVPSGTDMLVVDKCLSANALRQDVQLGTLFTMTESASGRIYLAFASDEDRHRVLTLAQTEADPSVYQKIQAVIERKEEIAERAIEVDDEEQFAGIRCLSAAILDSSNQVCASISVSVPVTRDSDDFRRRAGEALLTAARQISKRLGAAVF